MEKKFQEINIIKSEIEQMQRKIHEMNEVQEKKLLSLSLAIKTIIDKYNAKVYWYIRLREL